MTDGEEMGHFKKRSSNMRWYRILSATYHLLFLCLFALFLLQTWKAWQKYERGSTMFLTRNVSPEERTFPLITICPFKIEQFTHAQDRWEYEEDEGPVRAYGVVGAGFLTGLQHNVTMLKNSSSDRFWSMKPVSALSLGRVLGCQTLTPEEDFAKQPDPEVRLYLATREYMALFMYLHTAEQTMLPSGTTLYGSLAVMPHVPKVFFKDKVRVEQHQVKTARIEALPRKVLPCASSANDKVDLRECVDAKFEDEFKCHVPWSNKTPLRHNRVCNEAGEVAAHREFNRKVQRFPTSEGLFRATGCHYSCNYTAFQTTITYSGYLTPDMIPDSDEFKAADVTLIIGVSLDPSEVEVREEVVIFDFLDLVGNVGGYMGLLLGWSLLSMAEGVKRRIGNMIDVSEERN